ncbi:MAG: YraN family protein [Actinomycetota bacterium]|nr:YraN family protein [Actinomycetota bacterium]
MDTTKGSHLERGRWGEDMATAWYRQHGYAIVARNWRCPSGEVDLIVRRGRLLVISEVKARRSDAYGPAAAAVGPAKQQRLRRLAAEYLRTTGTHGVDVRFDVVAITGSTMDIVQHAF